MRRILFLLPIILACFAFTPLEARGGKGCGGGGGCRKSHCGNGGGCRKGGCGGGGRCCNTHHHYYGGWGGGWGYGWGYGPYYNPYYDPYYYYGPAPAPCCGANVQLNIGL